MKRRVPILFLSVLLAACSTTPVPETPAAVVETIPPSPVYTATPAATQLPSATPTQAVIPGTLKVQVNVRAGPGTSYPSLGLIDSGQPVAVLNQTADGVWLQIVYLPGEDGIGWVSAQFVQVGERIIPSQTALVTPTAIGPTAKITQRLNVRAGPATTYDMLGTLEVDVVITLTGRNETGTWLQVQYPPGSDGRGWVNAAYVQVDASMDLPRLDARGTPVTPAPAADGTSAPGASPTPLPGLAAEDGDSAEQPLVQVVFSSSSSGTHRFTFQGDLSAPEGDAEDWIEFIPSILPGAAAASMTASLACSGVGSLEVELWQDGALVPGWGSLACGGAQHLRLPSAEAYQFHLGIAPGQGLQYVQYQLSLKSDP